MAKEFYAVKNGRKTGIYRTWEECRKHIDRFPGAQFKGFETKQEAEAYLGMEVPTETDGTSTDLPDLGQGAEKARAVEASSETATEDLQELPVGTIIAYVDGSYNGSDTEFSYGMVILEGEKEFQFSKKIEDEELAKMHNVAGEIAGAMAAMEYAVAHQKKGVIIYHDYEGIAKWCTGEWKTNKEGTIVYKRYYEKMRQKLRIEFIKVRGHSHDRYNDMADMLAKQALGIPST